MTNFRNGINDYVEIKRALGYKFQSQSRALYSLADYMDLYKIKTVTLDVVNKWFKSSSKVKIGGHHYMKQLSIVRKFCEYWIHYDNKTELISREIKGPKYYRPEPYIYSSEEYKRILMECANLQANKSLRSYTYYTFFGLIMTTGIRTHEAINLNNDDIDFKSRIISIENTKFNKNRRIPIDKSTVEVLKKYKKRKEMIFQSQSDNCFFISEKGCRISKDSVGLAFRIISQRIGLRAFDESYGPRIYDMRHTFAVSTLNDWLKNGVDIQEKFPVLSTYLGHIKPNDTYWYLSVTNELLRNVQKRVSNEN